MFYSQKDDDDDDDEVVVFLSDENEGNTTEKRETLDFRVSKIFKKPKKKKNSSPFLLTFSTKHTHCERFVLLKLLK